MINRHITLFILGSMMSTSMRQETYLKMNAETL